MKKNKTIWILVLYLLGLFMGALDTGIVTPARSIIQADLGVNETLGIWMITIFTLAYASSIPITGKLADRFGSKVMYMVSIFLFGSGSLICALSSFTDSFAMLLIGRVIQAIGGGGIMPIVTAQIGTTFPPEKRGVALGLVGGVYGIANVLGSSAGSFILGLVGNSGWMWLFLINIPITAFILVAGLFMLENHRADVLKKMDLSGTVVLTAMILSLMYALTNLEFFDFMNTLTSTSVYPYIILFALLIPFLIWIEKRAEDPILNLKYFTDKNMIITYLTGILVGVNLMGMIFVPQFAENALKIKTGAGGYFVTILALFSGIGAPLSGKFIDKYSAKAVLMAGFLFDLIGGLFLVLVATHYMNIWTVLISLFFMGLGLGFTMGTPLNYMVLSAVHKRESNSALATLSLIRSVGTIISPAIMIGFIAAAGANLQPNLMNVLPEPPTQLAIQQVEELKPLLEQIKKDPELMKRIDPAMLDVDAMMSQSTASSNSESTFELSDAMLNDLKTADVTNISQVLVKLSDQIYSANVTPELITKIQTGIQEGITGLETGTTEMEKAKAQLIVQQEAMGKKIMEMQQNIAELDKAKAGIQKGIEGTAKGIEGMNAALIGAKAAHIPPQIAALETQIASAQTQKLELEKKLKDLNEAQTGMKTALKGMTSAVAGMTTGISEIDARLVLLEKTSAKMSEVVNAIPVAFETSKSDYLKTVEAQSPEIQKTFQEGLNIGFRQMYFLVALMSALGILILAFYKTPIKAKDETLEIQAESL